MAVVTSAAQEPRLLALRLLRGLQACQDATGNLREPGTGRALGADHYAVSLFGGACALAGAPDLQGPADRAVRYVLGLPAPSRGAHELNNLGLLAAYRMWCGGTERRRVCGRLEAYLARMPFASLRGHTTNNWHAMRAVCLLQRGLALGRPTDVEAALRCLHHDVLPLQDAAGLFADYPPRQTPGLPCTPLTYHAKFCAMLATFLAHRPDHQAAEALRRGALALARLAAPDGEALYFGRSCNSLYGYAAALHALCWALRLGVVTGEEAALVADASGRVGRFLGGLVGPDGKFRTYPTPFERERLGWDDYVHGLDYAAFAAFLLAQTPGVPAPSGRVGPVRWQASEAGLWVEGEGRAFAAFSTHGQFHPGSYLFTDARYSGLQVLTWKHKGHTVVPPPPHEAQDPTDPRWVGFMPVVEARGGVWAVRRYQEVRVFPSPAGVAFVARGVPVRLRRTPSHRAARRAERSSWVRLALRGVRAAARRLGVRTPTAYAVEALGGVQVRRALVWFREDGCLVCADQVDGGAAEAWATVRLSAPPVPGEGAMRFYQQGLRGELRFLCGVQAGPRVEEAFTSNGLAYVVRYPIYAGAAGVVAIALEDAETSCEAAGGRLRVHVGSKTVEVDLRGLEVRW